MTHSYIFSHARRPTKFNGKKLHGVVITPAPDSKSVLRKREEKAYGCVM